MIQMKVPISFTERDGNGDASFLGAKRVRFRDRRSIGRLEINTDDPKLSLAHVLHEQFTSGGFQH